MNKSKNEFYFAIRALHIELLHFHEQSVVCFNLDVINGGFSLTTIKHKRNQRFVDDVGILLDRYATQHQSSIEILRVKRKPGPKPKSTRDFDSLNCASDFSLESAATSCTSSSFTPTTYSDLHDISMFLESDLTTNESELSACESVKQSFSLDDCSEVTSSPANAKRARKDCDASSSSITSTTVRKRKVTERLNPDSGSVDHKKMVHFAKTEDERIKSGNEALQRVDLQSRLIGCVSAIRSKHSDNESKFVAVDFVLNLMFVECPPSHLLLKSQVLQSVMELLMSGIEEDNDLLVATLDCVYRMLLLDETYKVNVMIVLAAKPLPLLVRLVNAHWYSKLRALDVLNMVGQGGVFGELLDIGLLEAILEVAQSEWSDDLLLHIAKILKNMCSDRAVAGRVVRSHTIQPMLNIVIRSFQLKHGEKTIHWASQMLSAMLTFAHTVGHASTLWEEVLQQAMQSEGGVLVVLVGLLDKKSPQIIKCHAATALGDCLALCDRQEVTNVLKQINPFTALLKSLTPRKRFGATTKEVPSVVRCLSILCVNHGPELLRAAGELATLDVARFFDLMADYRDSDTKDKDLIRYAESVTETCLNLWNNVGHIAAETVELFVEVDGDEDEEEEEGDEEEKKDVDEDWTE